MLLQMFATFSLHWLNMQKEIHVLEEDLGVECGPPAWKKIHLGYGSIALVLHGLHGIHS